MYAFQESPWASPQQMTLWGLMIVHVRKQGLQNHHLSCEGDSFCRNSGALSAPVASGFPFWLQESSRQFGSRLGMSLGRHANRLHSLHLPASQPCRNNKCWLSQVNGDMVEVCKHTPRESITQTGEACSGFQCTVATSHRALLLHGCPGDCRASPSGRTLFPNS